MSTRKEQRLPSGDWDDERVVNNDRKKGDSHILATNFSVRFIKNTK
jgi:hypothetical protein